MSTILFLLITGTIAYAFGVLLKRIQLPPLLGYLLIGLITRNAIPINITLSNTVIQIITTFALSVIVLKAGLGIRRHIIKSIGFRVLLLGTIPNILEASVIAILSILLLQFSTIEAFMFGFIISAVSPAVVIPSMTRLQDQGFDQKTTTLNLASTSFDDVVSLTMFAVFLALYQGNNSASTALLLAPVKIIIGALLGAVIGFIVAKVFTTTSSRLLQIIQVLCLLLLSLLLKQYAHIIYAIDMIAIMVVGYQLRNKNELLSNTIKKDINSIWSVAQIYLFFSIGYLVNISVVGSSIWIGIVLICIGLIVRIIGVQIALSKSNFSQDQRTFSMIASIPKATVQAVLGAVPLMNNVHQGDIILSFSVLSILLTAPLGLILIEIYATKLLHLEIKTATL